MLDLCGARGPRKRHRLASLTHPKVKGGLVGTGVVWYRLS